jgi:hypothetical protein
MLRSIVLSFVLFFPLSMKAQTMITEFDKIVFGTYKVDEIYLKEYVLDNSGNVQFTSDMQKVYTKIGDISKENLKEIIGIVNGKEWNDFMEFDLRKDYQYIRIYQGKYYVEAMWGGEVGKPQEQMLMRILQNAVAGLPLPERKAEVKK